MLVEAIVMLFWCKFLLLLLPFKKVLGINYGKNKDRKTVTDRELLLKIKRSLYRANRLSLWKNKCLVQSFAGRWMLQRRGIQSQIAFGIKHTEINKIIAHAWLKADDFLVIGQVMEYNEIISL